MIVRASAPLAALLLAGAGLAAGELTTAIAPATAHVGDPITLTISWLHEAGVSYEVPRAPAKLGELDVLAFERATPVKQQDGQIKETITYRLAAFRLGKFQIPSVAVNQIAPAPAVLESRAGEVEITSILTGQEKDIEDVKGPMSIPYEWPWRWIAGGLLAVVAGAVVWWFLRRRRRTPAEGEAVREEPLLSPEDEAVEALRRLDNAGYLPRGEIKKHCVGLTEILKHYIYRRHAVPVEERTTEEIIDHSKQVLPGEVFSLLRGFLARADMIKFAKYQAAPDELREMMKWTLRIIEISRPALEAEVEQVGA